MKLEFVKWIAASVLLILTTLFASLPVFMLPKVQESNQGRNRTKYTRVISLLSCCGGGVFIGTCLLHLFPDVQKQMTKVFDMLQMRQTFPVSEFLLAFGFLLILVIEQIVLAFKQQSKEEEEVLPFLGHQHSHSHDNNVDTSREHYHHSSYGTVSSDVENSENERSFHKDKSSHSHLRSVVLVLALSLHSVFEGLAIGLQSSAENVIRILVAVLIHKSVIAFTLGLNLTHSKFTRNVIIRCITIFSLMSPIGTIAGSLISDIGSGLSMAVTSGVLQGIAAGTFVYVTFFEVLPHELNSGEDKMCKLLFLLFGFSAMSILVLYVPS